MGAPRKKAKVDLKVDDERSGTSAELLKDAYGLSPNTQRQGGSEDIVKFIERVQATADEYLIRAEGNVGVVAAVYGIESSLMADIIKTTDRLIMARDEGLIIASARKTRSEKFSAEIKKRKLQFLKEEDRRIKRDKWPENKDARAAALAETLRSAIEQYRGDEMAMASALNVAVSEIRDCVADDVELQEMMEQGKMDAKEQVISHLYHLATTSQSPTAAIHWLKHQASEEWGDKKEVTINHKGFAPPDENEGGGSVLKMVVNDED